jgi:molybdopterin converting factor subunit 1
LSSDKTARQPEMFGRGCFTKDTIGQPFFSTKWPVHGQFFRTLYVDTNGIPRFLWSMNTPITVLLFGITRDITGQNTIQQPLPAQARVSDLMEQLQNQYPRLSEIRALLVAVNGEYAEPDTPLTPTDEVALIPPVSGG